MGLAERPATPTKSGHTQMIVTSPPPQLPKLFSEREFAEYLGVSVDTVRRERWRGNLGHLRIGSRVFYTVEHALDLHRRTRPGLLQPSSGSAMQQDRPQHLGQIGNIWLSQRPNSPVWCRTWFDRLNRPGKAGGSFDKIYAAAEEMPITANRFSASRPLSSRHGTGPDWTAP